MTRRCPECGGRTVATQEILFGDTRCQQCQHVVGVHWIPAGIFSLIIFLVTLITTIIVFVQLGFYAALLWFTLPIGALSFVKASLSPLESRIQKNGKPTPGV